MFKLAVYFGVGVKCLSDIIVGTILGLSQDLKSKITRELSKFQDGTTRDLSGFQDGTTRELSLRERRHNLLSKTVNAFKTNSSKLIHQTGINFRWQRSFYDHVIGFDEYELQNIQEYIKNNPAKWEFDRMNKGVW